MINNTIKHLPKAHRISLLGLFVLLLLILFWPVENVNASKTTAALHLEVGVKYPVVMPEFLVEGIVESDFVEPADYLFHEVKRGDTLAKIFSGFNLSPQTTYKVSRAGADAKNLVSLKPGDLLYLQIDEA
jgi:cell envelope opacity-associated protein A